ncbi:hypothetical protein EVAR_62032_1 [Eumeta japonica]|uniref:Uncharacterized protein n=1 Tax=Eumeta variegata TaxID=151549 RepID=A0A4C1ZDN6_EUMVA|nr:hypothetical protein EVAR_62032_1 [Eumeta japonica]
MVAPTPSTSSEMTASGGLWSVYENIIRESEEDDPLSTLSSNNSLKEEVEKFQSSGCRGAPSHDLSTSEDLIKPLNMSVINGLMCSPTRAASGSIRLELKIWLPVKSRLKTYKKHMTEAKAHAGRTDRRDGTKKDDNNRTRKLPPKRGARYPRRLDASDMNHIETYPGTRPLEGSRLERNGYCL